MFRQYYHWVQRIYLSLIVLLFAPLSQASEINDPAAGWDRLWHEVVIDLTIMGVIFAAVTTYFIIKYRRKSPDQEGAMPKLTRTQAIGWAVIPAFVFLADDLYIAANGWALWNDYRQVPEDRLEIQMESGMYSWTYTYPNGRQTYNELRVPAGKPIMLRMTSRDTIHNHFIPDFRVKEDAMPGRVTYLWFHPKEPGEHIVSCTEYCGIWHSRMDGKIIVMPENDYALWYQQEQQQIAADEGQILEGVN